VTLLLGTPEGSLDGALLDDGNEEGPIEGDAETLGSPLGS
jgi:hypothetical protein